MSTQPTPQQVHDLCRLSKALNEIICEFMNAPNYIGGNGVTPGYDEHGNEQDALPPTRFLARYHRAIEPHWMALDKIQEKIDRDIEALGVKPNLGEIVGLPIIPVEEDNE
mgnify:CR=1 FL=1